MRTAEKSIEVSANVYLPKGVLEKLKNQTPRNDGGNQVNRYHQNLTKETGAFDLDKQL